MMHTVVLVRHAKAEQHNPDDHSRRLTDRGSADAARLGGVLAAMDLGRVEALVSSGVRALQTWEQIAVALDAAGLEAAGTQILDELYTADRDDVFTLLGGLDDAVRTAIVVGHNPTIAATAWDLHDGSETPAFGEMRNRGYPPCAATVLAHGGDWAAIGSSSATLTTFLDPRTGR